MTHDLLDPLRFTADAATAARYLAPGSVSAVVTSSPFWRKRVYRDKNELGWERTPFPDQVNYSFGLTGTAIIP